MSDLTPKQKLFIAEYLVDKNATQSAIRAGYSEKTAPEQGCRLLSNVNVKQELDRLIAAQQKRVLVTADSVIKDIIEIGDEAREKGDMGNALKSRELLGKHLKLFTEKLEVNASINNKFAEMSASEKAKFLIDKENECK